MPTTKRERPEQDTPGMQVIRGYARMRLARGEDYSRVVFVMQGDARAEGVRDDEIGWVVDDLRKEGLIPPLEPEPADVNESPDPTISWRFRKEDGSEYTTEFDVMQDVKLVSGESIPAVELQPGDEVESHHSAETGGTGHIAVGLVSA